MSMGSKVQFEPGSWLEVLYEVYIGIVMGVGHSVKMGSKYLYQTFIVSTLKLIGMDLQASDTVQSKDGEKALKVVAVGYGRTGTVGRCSHYFRWK